VSQGVNGEARDRLIEDLVVRYGERTLE